MRVTLLYGLYFGPILVLGLLITRSVYMGARAAESAAPESFVCDSVARQLESELWLLYDGDVRQAQGERADQFDPLPGHWRKWEATRVVAEKNCGEQTGRMAALLQLRRALQNNLFLLRHEAGEALSVLHQL